MLNVISLGAGVQSSTMALMAAHGEIEPMPDCAIFADTQAEPKHVYSWLGWLETELPFPVYRVSKGDLRQDIIDSISGKRSASVPFFTESNTGREGQLRRQCTREYKVEPITKELRRLLGYKPRQRIPPGLVTSWIGISTDEAVRMKPSRERWVDTRWPLIESGMSRYDCLEWMKRYGIGVVEGVPKRVQKSSCTFCPYHNNAMWREIKNEDPESWDDAVQMDEIIRNGVKGTKEKIYLHRSLVPLAEVDFRNLEDMGQLNMFNNECEGMCGV